MPFRHAIFSRIYINTISLASMLPQIDFIIKVSNVKIFHLRFFFPPDFKLFRVIFSSFKSYNLDFKDQIHEFCTTICQTSGVW